MTGVQPRKSHARNSTPFKTSIIPHLQMFVRAVLTPAQLCRKKWILSTPDRTCHQAAPWSSLPLSSSLNGVPRHPFIPTVSTVSCRLTLAAPSNQPGFGERVTNRNTYYGVNYLLLKMMLQVLRSTKHPSLRYHRSVQTNSSTKQRVPPS